MSSLKQVGRMLLPGRLTSAARRLPLDEFMRSSGCRTVLLLRVPDQEQELAWGLNQTYGTQAGSEAEQPKVLDFHTAIIGGAENGCQYGGAKRSAVRGFELEDLMSWIGAARCFAVPVEQRGGAFSGRISVGRARNKDLSQRSQNISKLHAWFEYDVDGTLFVADAGSKNGTKVANVSLRPREPVALANGTELSFGPLEAMVCSVEQFWEVSSVV